MPSSHPAPASGRTPTGEERHHGKDYLDSVRVLTKKETLHATGLSEDTWDRLKERGETPPETQLSERRFGYRLVDVKKWLDRRRIGQATATAAILFLTIIIFPT